MPFAGLLNLSYTGTLYPVKEEAKDDKSNHGIFNFSKLKNSFSIRTQKIYLSIICHLVFCFTFSKCFFLFLEKSVTSENESKKEEVLLKAREIDHCESTSSQRTIRAKSTGDNDEGGVFVGFLNQISYIF